MMYKIYDPCTTSTFPAEVLAWVTTVRTPEYYAAAERLFTYLADRGHLTTHLPHIEGLDEVTRRYGPNRVIECTPDRSCVIVPYDDFMISITAATEYAKRMEKK